MSKKVNSNISGVYTLTPLQQAMLFYRMLDDTSVSYVEQSEFQLRGRFEVNVFKTALELVTARYDVLRSAIIIKGTDDPLQIIFHQRNTELNYMDLSNNEEKNNSIAHIKNEDIKRNFDLGKDTVIRVMVLKCSDTEHTLLWSFHHIYMDGWSFNLVNQKCFHYYQRLVSGEAKESIIREILMERNHTNDFGTYLKWMQKQDRKIADHYWKELIENCTETSEIPTICHEQKGEGIAAEIVSIDTKRTDKIYKACHKLGVTINTLVETALGVLISRYCYSDCVVFGKVVSGREKDIKGIQEMVGLLINTIPCVVDLTSDIDVCELICAMKAQALESMKYDYCSLADIQNMSELLENMIKVLFCFENYYAGDQQVKEEELQVEIHSVSEVTNYDLTVTCLAGEEVAFKVTYNRECYSQSEMEGFLEKLTLVLCELAENPFQKVSKIKCITKKEEEDIKNRFNDTATDYPADKTVVELFEEMVEKYADHTAIISEDRQLTYAELNTKANIVASKLKKAGVGPDEFVAIMAEKNMEVIVGICGILKAGGAYVPIDPSYPQERIDFILRDCMPKAVLTCVGTEIKCDIPTINLGEIPDNITNQMETRYDGSGLAYCMYTSGTTGMPKGSLIEHKNIIRLVKNTNYLKLNEKTTIMQTGSLSFDASTLEIWGTLLNGGKLVLAEDHIMTNCKLLKEYISKYKVNTMWMTSTLYNQMILTDAAMFDCLDYLLIGGEKLSEDHVRLLKKRDNSVTLINGYGPTENTTFTTTYEIPKEFHIIPIGKPIANTRVYILKENQLCGVGIPGELCTTGAGVSRGYLNQAELTAARFVENPFGSGKMYHTGDLARWLPDGNIEYLGRLDEQIKIRGFRIELGEIETTIRRMDDIKDCAVIAGTDETGEKVLSAYIVADRNVCFTEIRKEMAKTLPDYMIPGNMLQIDKIPVSRNGKLDRRALPKIENKSDNTYVAPRNEMETVICNIFSKILGVAKVGINDNFFELGGHSLRATRLVNQMEAGTGYRAKLKDIFTYATPEKLAGLVLGDKEEVYSAIPKAEEKDTYVMSPAQKRIFLICQMDMEGTVYNMPQFFKIDGIVNLEKIRGAYSSMLERHEILRTGFMLVDGEPVQVIYDKVQEDFEYQEDYESDDDSLINAFVRPFCLEKPPQVRMKLYKRPEGFLLFMDFHHIVGDGMSMGTFIDEFAGIYSGEELPAPQKQYRDYSEWFRRRDLTSQKEYWLSQFDDDIPVLNLTYDFQRPQEQSYEGSIIMYEGNKELCEQIKTLAREKGVTDFMVLLAGAMILLSLYSHQDDIVIGSAINGRTHNETENMLGMFVNTLALRGKPAPEKKFSEFLEEVKETCLKAYENQEYPFEELVDALGIQRDLSRNPIFDVMFALQNNEKTVLRMGDSPVESLGNEGTAAKFDLTLNIMETDQIFVFGLEYSTALFKAESIQNMAIHYEAILEQIVKDPGIRIKEIASITAKERKMILEVFNDTYAPYPSEKTMVEIFEELAFEKSNHIAIEYEDQSLTYGELNAMANSLAHFLRKKGIGRNDMVAIIAQRGITMFAGILGIMKAGGAYVPIDSTYPTDRIEFMISDCAPKAVLVYGAEIEGSSSYTILDEAIFHGNTDNPEQVNTPNDLAYVIYTSGTTGRPKAVLLEHHGLVAMRSYLMDLYQVEDSDHVLQFANYVFDASVWEMTLGLFTGATLVIVSSDTIADISRFNEFIEKKKITLTLLPPQYYLQTEVRGLKVLTTGGSVTNQEVLARASENGRYINAYGPTENTVLATHWEYKGEKVHNIPIGKPISNSQIYILYEDRLCGIGVPGELCIAGAGVARGYLNRDEQTKVKFVKNPFGPGKMYRSGDLARWLPDGNIEYLGRLDEQVKIRGFRIELGEIESVLRKIEYIDDCVVIDRMDANGDNSLYAYIVSDKKIPPMDEIKSKLEETLPDYMVPPNITKIDNIPITKSGKIDKRALPEIKTINEKNYVAPETEAEKILCDAVADIFKLDRVGVNDNFFELGGDSIKAISLISNIRKYDYELTIKNIMTRKIIGKIATYAKKNAVILYSQEECNGNLKPLPVMNYYLHYKGFRNLSHFNQTMMLCRSSIDREAIQAVINEIVLHHDVLRLVKKGKEVVIRPYNEVAPVCFNEIDIRDVNASEKDRFVEKRCTEIQAGFDLENGPLYQFAILKDTEMEHLFLCLHHFVIDGVSWRILMDDIDRGYEEYLDHKKITLPPKTASYIEWCSEVEDYKKSEKFVKEENYWRQIMEQIPDINHSKSLGKRSGIFNEKSFVIEADLVRSLMNDVPGKFGTDIQEELLAALVIAFHKNGIVGEQVIKLEGHGRQPLHKNVDISRTVGWFTTVYPIILKNGSDITETLLLTKERLREIPNHGFAYGLVSGDMRNMEISFNYLGQIEDRGQERNGFDISELPCGSNISADNEFDETFLFTGSIYKEELSITINYDNGRYNDELVTGITRGFKEALQNIVDLSMNMNERTQTISDIGTSGDMKESINEINRVVENMNNEEEELLDSLLSVF